MKKTYLEEFKEKYGFLEDYGFILAVDPYNPKRLCYKNAFGEIVLWTNNEKNFFNSYQIYVQINAWKYEIDVKKDYKKYIGKCCLFKPFEIVVKELFEYMVKTNKDFYGLKIVKNNFKPYSKLQEKEIESYENSYNPLDSHRESSKVAGLTITGFVILIAQLFLAILLNGFRDYELIYLFKTIIYSSILILGLLLVIIIHEYLNIFSKLYLLIYPIILLLLLNFLPKRIDYIIYAFFFVVSFIYTSYYLIAFKLKNKKGLVNGLITCVYPFIIYLIKTFTLSKYIFMVDIKAKVFLIVSAIMSVLATVVYIVLRKDKTKKGDYIGGLLATICCTLLVSFVLPFFITQNINYSFDNSTGEVSDFLIIDKEIRNGYKSTNYYLTIIIEGKEQELSVKKYVYYLYDENDNIDLSYHEGFLGFSYYEYVTNE